MGRAGQDQKDPDFVDGKCWCWRGWEIEERKKIGPGIEGGKKTC